MTDSKVYVALEHLSIYELNSFKKYLDSPYFNVNESLITLYEIYEPLLKGKLNDTLSKELIWEIVLPGKKYIDKKYRKLHSELLKLFEDFIAQKAYDNNKFLRANLTLQAVRTRKLEKLYKSVSASADRALEHSYNRSSEYLYAKYFNENEKLQFYSDAQLQRKRAKNIASDLNISETVKYLDQFYIAEKLKHYVKLLSWKKVLTLEQKIDYIDLLKIMIEDEEIENIPPIAIYNTISKTLLNQDDEENYYTLKRQVDEFIDYFPEKEIGIIYDAILTFCVTMVNKGNLSFQEETLDVYKGALAKETLFENGYLTTVSFNNIVFFALRVGEYDWAEQFVENYMDRLNDTDRPSSVSISLARIEFYRKNYGKVIELLQEVEMNSAVYNLSSKTILLLSYYELDEFDALDSFINSFRVFLNREKSISARKKNAYKNLLKYVTRLINLRDSDKVALLNLKTEIEETPDVGSKPWLLQKLIQRIN
ncbi:MAG: hypothetical protein ACJA1A_002463 [Saprospiraceae bacterium]|jgi:hypothetical protein